VPSNVSGSKNGVATTGGHKTLPDRNMRIYREIHTRSQHWEKVALWRRLRVYAAAVISCSGNVTWKAAPPLGLSPTR
jgi:hypothetical protein